MPFLNRTFRPSGSKTRSEPESKHLQDEESPAELPPVEGQDKAFQTTVISIIIAIGVYGIVFGIPFAVGFILLILVHEMGHVIMLRHLGYRATTPVFIPFVGALIGMKDQPKNAQTEALVAYGGPFIGTVGAYLVFLYYQLVQDQFYLQLAFVGFLINLFNMVPLSPLDGGRIATAISRWLWLPGVALLGFLFFVTWNPIILIVVGIGISRAYKSVFKPEGLETEGYYTIEPGIRILVSLAYFGLILFLSRMTMLSYQLLEGHM